MTLNCQNECCNLLATDTKLREQAKNNPITNFKFGFDDLFMDKLFADDLHVAAIGTSRDLIRFIGLVKVLIKPIYQDVFLIMVK